MYKCNCNEKYRIKQIQIEADLIFKAMYRVKSSSSSIKNKNDNNYTTITIANGLSTVG